MKILSQLKLTFRPYSLFIRIERKSLKTLKTKDQATTIKNNKVNYFL